MSRWEIALINIMIIIINQCLFYYLYIVFKTGTPIELGVMNIKNLTPLFLYEDIFHLCIHDILRIYNILTTPLNSSLAYGCWPGAFMAPGNLQQSWWCKVVHSFQEFPN